MQVRRRRRWGTVELYQPSPVARIMLAMDCPACGKRAIRFWVWCQGLNAMRYICPHCGTRLRGSTAWKWLVIMILLVPGEIFGAFALANGTGWGYDRCFVLILVPTVSLLSFVAYRTGAYVEARKDTSDAG